MWLACHTQEEIAEVLNTTHTTVQNVLQEMADLPKVAKPSAEHNDGIGEDGEPIWKVPIYNVWKFKEKSKV